MKSLLKSLVVVTLFVSTPVFAKAEYEVKVNAGETANAQGLESLLPKHKQNSKNFSAKVEEFTVAGEKIKGLDLYGDGMISIALAGEKGSELNKILNNDIHVDKVEISAKDANNIVDGLLASNDMKKGGAFTYTHVKSTMKCDGSIKFINDDNSLSSCN